MKTRFQRLTALLLALAMCISLMSVNVWAAEADPASAPAAALSAQEEDQDPNDSAFALIDHMEADDVWRLDKDRYAQEENGHYWPRLVHQSVSATLVMKDGTKIAVPTDSDGDPDFDSFLGKVKQYFAGKGIEYNSIDDIPLWFGTDEEEGKPFGVGTHEAFYKFNGEVIGTYQIHVITLTITAVDSEKRNNFAEIRNKDDADIWPDGFTIKFSTGETFNDEMEYDDLIAGIKNLTKKYPGLRVDTPRGYLMVDDNWTPAPGTYDAEFRFETPGAWGDSHGLSMDNFVYTAPYKVTLIGDSTDEPEPTPEPTPEPEPNVTATTLSSAKYDKKAKTVTVKWSKNTTGKGYELQYSTDKKFKKSVKKVKIGKNKTTKTTIKKLKKGTYYVRIRTVNGKKTSAWSKTKSVKVK